jgi:hypothetical protein
MEAQDKVQTQDSAYGMIKAPVKPASAKTTSHLHTADLPPIPAALPHTSYCQSNALTAAHTDTRQDMVRAFRMHCWQTAAAQEHE